MPRAQRHSRAASSTGTRPTTGLYEEQARASADAERAQAAATSATIDLSRCVSPLMHYSCINYTVISPFASLHFVQLDVAIGQKSTTPQIYYGPSRIYYDPSQNLLRPGPKSTTDPAEAITAPAKFTTARAQLARIASCGQNRRAEQPTFGPPGRREP